MKSEINKQKILNAATKSLLYEVTVNPKPGLVDPVSNGSHRDMDVFDFINSGISLVPYFENCFLRGKDFKRSELPVLFQELRPQGIIAEKKMLAATAGVNTHKGAIFSLGVFVTATAFVCQNNEFTLNNLQQTIIQMLAGLVEHDFNDKASKRTLTEGEKQFFKYGKKGIRGEAELGYPVVFKYGLPFLRQTSGTRNQRLLDTLMYIISFSEDSNLIKRAGTTQIIEETHVKARRFLKYGGSKSVQGMKFLQQMEAEFSERDLSLGGSADLLILTIYLGLLKDLI